MEQSTNQASISKTRGQNPENIETRSLVNTKIFVKSTKAGFVKGPGKPVKSWNFILASPGKRPLVVLNISGNQLNPTKKYKFMEGSKEN